MNIRQFIHYKRQIHAHSLSVGRCPAATLVKPDAVIGHTYGKSISCGFRLRLGHKVAEGGQRGKLAGSEEIRKVSKAIIGYIDGSFPKEFPIRVLIRPLNIWCLDLCYGW